MRPAADSPRAPVDSSPELLVLHALRLTGMADAAAVAERFALAEAEVAELLLDFEATGWVSRVAFADTRGWTLTARGAAENEGRLAAELAASGKEPVVRAAYGQFRQFNDRLLRACTDWQLRPAGSGRLVENRHSDAQWDHRVLVELTLVGSELLMIQTILAGCLSRLAGYHTRYADALARVEHGDLSGVAEPRADSCHTVWMELHEDLIATLGERR